MTADDFRKLALALPEARESAHMQHPDFRIGKRVFATLHYPDVEFGMVKLTPLQQSQFVAAYPKAFEPVPGGWGLRGATRVRLKAATRKALAPALFEAWRNAAPVKLARQHTA
jgi:hypothetical protein